MRRCARLLGAPVVCLVHGGAWSIPPAMHARSVAGVRRAAKQGLFALRGGGSALDAVEQAVRVMEDDPVFDAGVGSALTAEGEVEMDAVVMNGRTLDAGAVACVRHVANPVSLGRLVMDATPHVLLVGAGAEAFARAHGVVTKTTDELVTPEARQMHEEIQRYQPGVEQLFGSGRAHDTVGAVAMDAAGNVAAATSTGGIPAKLSGRVGDSPLVGAGCFADNTLGAASTTGHGESIIKTLLAYRVLINARMADGEAARAAQLELETMRQRVGGCGGVVCLSPAGVPGLCHSTKHMPWALAREDDDGAVHAGMGAAACDVPGLAVGF